MGLHWGHEGGKEWKQSRWIFAYDAPYAVDKLSIMNLCLCFYFCMYSMVESFISTCVWLYLGSRTPPQKHHHKNTTTKTPPQKRHHKNTTTTPPQEHHHTNTTTKTPPHHHKNTTAPPQKHHHTTTKTPPQKHSYYCFPLSLLTWVVRQHCNVGIWLLLLSLSASRSSANGVALTFYNYRRDSQCVFLDLCKSEVK